MVDLTKYDVCPQSAHQKLAVAALGRKTRFVADIPKVLGAARAVCGQVARVHERTLVKILRAYFFKHNEEAHGTIAFMASPIGYVRVVIRTKSHLVQLMKLAAVCCEEFGIETPDVDFLCYDTQKQYTLPGLKFFQPIPASTEAADFSDADEFFGVNA